jgi:OOP family OmpA-OmpF porin
VLSIPAPDDGYLEAKINPGFNSFPLDLPDTAIQAKETVLFKFDQLSIDVGEIEKLDHLIASLKNIDLMHIRIEGHTDAKGAEGYNQKLSSKRADAVEKYLVSNGIEASKISKKGFGESMPVVPNDTDFNRAKNRRAELIPITSD